MLSAFGSKTGRNQPSNAQGIFGPATWLRSLIKPAEGYGVAYIDWSQQEFGIAAALSGDTNMMAAYQSGDPYLTLAKQVGAVPADATKQSHEAVREQYKQAVLGTQYGLEAEGLARKLGIQPIAARHILEGYRRTFSVFRKWSDGAVERAMLTGELSTVFGWHVHPAPDRKNPRKPPNERSLRNFPMQANGAEMIASPASAAPKLALRFVPQFTTLCSSKRRSTGWTTMSHGCRRSWRRRRALCSTASRSAPTPRSSAIPSDTWTSAARRCGTS
jgi:hypothetical protein